VVVSSGQSHFESPRSTGVLNYPDQILRLSWLPNRDLAPLRVRSNALGCDATLSAQCYVLILVPIQCPVNLFNVVIWPHLI
jgi:hypothetical protein